MSNEEIHINYSLADIERYLQGRMTAKEMHAMEKAALQDAFLADAIEGYSEAASLTEAHKHLNEIAAALKGDKQKAKVVAMPAKYFAWWRIAALLVIIIGTVTIGFFVWNKGDKKTGLAVNEKMALPETDTIKAADEREAAKPLDKNVLSLSAENKPGQEKKVISKKIAGNAPLAKKEEDTKATVRRDEEASAITDMKDVKAETDSAQLDSGVAMGYAAMSKPIVQQSLQGKVAGLTTTQLNEFKGRVVNKNNEPIADALVKLNNNATTITDANGFFNYKAPDSVVNANINALGFASATVPLKSNTFNNIVVEEDKQSLSEVVVTAMNSKHKADKNKSDANGTMPEGGWQSFQEYVYKKLHKPFDSTNSSAVINGNIDLEFSINESGKPYDFKVLHSADDTTANQAIEAIKDGPRWITTKKEKKARVTLKF